MTQLCKQGKVLLENDFRLRNKYQVEDEFIFVELIPGILEVINDTVSYTQEFGAVEM